MSCPDDGPQPQPRPGRRGCSLTLPPPRCQPPAALPRPCDKRPPRSLPAARRLQEGHRQPIYCGAFNHFAHQLGNLLATVGGNRVRRLAAACTGWSGRQYLRAAL